LIHDVFSKRYKDKKNFKYQIILLLTLYHKVRNKGSEAGEHTYKGMSALMSLPGQKNTNTFYNFRLSFHQT